MRSVPIPQARCAPRSPARRPTASLLPAEAFARRGRRWGRRRRGWRGSGSGWRWRRTAGCGRTARVRALPARLSQLQLGFETLCLGLPLAQRGYQPLAGAGLEFVSAVHGPKDGVAQRFGSLVGELARPIRIDTQLAFVDDVLR